MSDVILEGFATYGTGTTGAAWDGGTSTPLASALLAGIYAELGPTIGATLSGGCSIAKGLPWDTSDTSYWLTPTAGSPGTVAALRRVLPASGSLVCVSMRIAFGGLPQIDYLPFLTFLDASKNRQALLYCGTTGDLKFAPQGGTASFSSGPVFVSETAHHVEVKFDQANKICKVYVDGALALNATGFTLTNDVAVAQFNIGGFFQQTGGVLDVNEYITDIIVRDDATSFPVGDRRVATLFPNRDDASHQGWTARPLHRFGVGVLDLTAANAAVRTGVTTHTDIGANEFTIEGQFRFKTLPTGSSKAVLFGKWDEDNNERSYQLYLGGPSLENGYLVFRTSTDGANGTVVEKFKWPWNPDVGRWYHVAMVRSSGDLLLFIDGIQQGLPVADTDTYFAGGGYTCLGAQTSGSNTVVNTLFNGWQDEFRLTIGVARYTANFTPPTEAFARNGSDPNWGDVIWLSSWDNAVVADDGPLALALTALNSAAAITPDDSDGAYETINSMTPDDDVFIEAALVPATGLLTFTAIPSASDTVTVGTKDGTNAAVYTFVATVSAAYDVKIGADIATSMANLAAAVNAGTGAGTIYGTGTVANADVSGDALPSGQFQATALTPGTAGNSIASTETAANGSWGGTTLTGGLDIPAYSQFGLSRLPAGTTIVDSIAIGSRQWKTDSGTGQTKISFVGSGGAKTDGSAYALSTTPSVHFDVFDTDPDTSGSLTPQTILGALVRIDRTE